MISINIGECIKSIRTEKGLSSRELSKRSGVSQAYISQIETGKNSKPSYDILHKLSQALNTPYLDLMLAAGYYTDEEIRYRQEQEDYFNSMTPEEFKEYEEDLHDAYLIEEYRKENFPDIAELLKTDVFFDKYKLTKDEKGIVYNILNGLFQDKKKNYPSDEQIEKLYFEFKKSMVQIKNSNLTSANNDTKEGE